MQRFKSLQPWMGTAAGLSVLVLGLCFGQSCAAAKEPLPQLLEQKPAVSALEVDALPIRIVVTIKGDPRTSRGFSWFMNAAPDDLNVELSPSSDFAQITRIPVQTVQVQSRFLERTTDGHFLFRAEKADSTILGYFTDEGRSVKWRPKDGARKPDHVEIGVLTRPETICRAEVSSLSPGTLWYWRIAAKGKVLSPVGSFKTAADPDKTDEVSFIQVSDTQNAYYNEHKRNEAAYGADTLLEALRHFPNADFVLHTGDFVETGSIEDEWFDLFKRSAPILTQTTVAPVAGNHEVYSLQEGVRSFGAFERRFNVNDALAGGAALTSGLKEDPDGGATYSFDWGRVHFAVLNTNDNQHAQHSALSPAQLEWLKKDVRASRERGAQWVILALHKGIYSKGYHSLEDADIRRVRQALTALIDDLRIDVVLQGHDHVYSRTKALKVRDNDDPSFWPARVTQSDFTYDADFFKVLHAPKGAVFVTADTAGTKANDAVADGTLKHLGKVRPALKSMTENELESYSYLFETGMQPHRSSRFHKKHTNWRDASEQSFIHYRVKGRVLVGEVYVVSGSLEKAEPRRVQMIDRFTIEKP